VDRAVESLESARRAAPEDVAVLNDLAVAYLELGERDQQLMPMLRALDVIERAAARDSTHLAVRFNRALILQRLYLIQNAERAWVRYLVMERDPRWRAEARAHARDIEKAVDTISWEPLLDNPPLVTDSGFRADIAERVRRSPQAAREFSFRLLGRWGEAVKRGDASGAGRYLGLAREIGAAAERLEADRSVTFAVRTIDALAPDRTRMRELGEAHTRMAAGFEAFFGSDFDAAAASLRHAERTFRLLGSPMARWAAFYQAATNVQKGDYESADGRFQGILAAGTATEPALIGKTIWGLGVSQLRRGHHDAASRYYRDAGPYIAQAREVENQGAISYLLSESLNMAGQSALGRKEVFRGLRILSPFRRSNYLNNHLATVATYAREGGLGYATLAVRDEVLEVARVLGKPDVLAWAHCARARDLAALNRLAQARLDVAEAMRWADRMPESGRERVRADVTLVLGQITRSDDPRSALPLLASVVESYRRMRLDLDLATAQYEAALAARGAGDLVGGRVYLHHAVEQIEKQRVSFETAEVRAAFYETVENVFDAMIETEVEGLRPASAFEYLERSREVLRMRGQSTARSATMGIDVVGERLPESMLLVEYALLRDRIIIWTVSRAGWRQHSVAVPRDSVAALVNTLLRGTGEANTGVSDARTEFFDLLLRPVAGELNGITQLTVVPDRELYRVPFAALRDGVTGRYVTEQYQVRTVPSAAFFLEGVSQARRVPVKPSALVIGNPALDTTAVLRLPDLPGSRREAQQVAGLYGGARLLMGPDARRGHVLDLIPDYSVFHFAGHAVFNNEQPELSYLALAPDPKAGGILYAREIGELRLSNVDVVVLSACSTLSPRTSRVGVTAGLAYSFLRAGAPATISTLWDVSDETTTELMVEFHRQMANGVPAAEALRLAQLRALRSEEAGPNALGAWAAFIYTGP
jgi:CHAT domain-containing protein